MQISFYNHANISQRKLFFLKKITNFLVPKIIQQSPNDALLKVRIVKCIRNSSDCIVYGNAQKEKRDRYTICIIAGLSRKRMVEVLAHEVAHIKQFVEDRLWAVGSRYQWVNTKSQIKLFEKQMDFKQYYNSPWEKEARKASTKYLKLLARWI